MNIDLQHYIDQARKSGMADEQIRQGLLQSGWSMNDINEALMKVPASAVLQPKLKAMMPKSLAVIFAVVAIAVVGYFAGVYYMANYQNFPFWPFEVTVPVSTFTPRPSPIATPDPTANWQTYRNEEYGFEVKYPVGFIYTENIRDSFNNQKWWTIAFNEGDNNRFKIEINIAAIGFECPGETKLESKLINNISMEREEVCGFTVYKFEKSSNLFLVISSPSSMENILIFDQILSTFKFTR